MIMQLSVWRHLPAFNTQEREPKQSSFTKQERQISEVRESETSRICWAQSGEGNGTQLQYCCLENPMDGGAWQAAVHEVAEGWTRLSDFTFTFHFHALEKEMATHSSVLAWRIPGAEKPGRLQSMGSHRVGHDQSDAAVLYRRELYRLKAPKIYACVPLSYCLNTKLCMCRVRSSRSDFK